MSDQKYRQRGYKDDGERREHEPRPPRQPRAESIGPRLPQFPARVTVARCANCGVLLPRDGSANVRCARCGFELHSCKQCVNFDAAARWECTQAIPARVSPKDAINDCAFYSMRMSSERETTSGGAPSSPASSSSSNRRSDDHRKAFEDLFKKP